MDERRVFYTTAEVAAMTGLSEATVRRERASLGGMKVGRKILFPVAKFNKLIGKEQG